MPYKKNHHHLIANKSQQESALNKKYKIMKNQRVEFKIHFKNASTKNDQHYLPKISTKITALLK